MASQQIYQFYAELDDFKPTIWRRFQVAENISVARLGYIIQVLFEMKASHLMAIDIPEGENRQSSLSSMFPDIKENEHLMEVIDVNKIRRYEILYDDVEHFSDPKGNIITSDATKVLLRHAITEPNHKLSFNYDFGDDWRISLTLEKVFIDKALPGAELPRVLEGEGFGIVEDVGGIGGLEDLSKAFKLKKGASYRQYAEWLGLKEFDITAFDIDDMNFRMKKIPRIYKQSYEDGLEPTQKSIDLIERKYLK